MCYQQPPLRSFGNLKLSAFGYCRNDEEYGSVSLVVVKVVLTAMCKKVPPCDQDTTTGFREAETLRR